MSLEQAIIDRKLERALMQLELSFTEVKGLVVYDPEEKTASWRYNERSGEESIHVGPVVAALDVPSIEMVLRHEILHRSLYNGFGELHVHHEIANLTLDICINRLLFEAYPDPMRKMSSSIYPAESKTGPIALADVSADPTKLPPELAELWQLIWTKTQGHYAPLNPASLYFRLLRLLEVGLLPKFEAFCKLDDHLPQRPGSAAERLGKAVAATVNRRLPRGSDLGQSLAEFSVVPMPIGTTEVEAFLEKMRARRIVDRLAKKVLAPLAKEIRVQPYPAYPTRLGLVYQLAGVSEVFGLYWNREVSNTGARMAIGIYMDVSGSMIGYYPVVAGFVDALKEVPLRLRSFDTVVRTIAAEDLAAGRIEGGGGTDFDAPILDLLKDRELSAGVLFTDGEAQVSPAIAARLRVSKKNLYVVYLTAGRAPPQSALDRVAKDTIVVPVASKG
ncbi:MAG: vWA domain-containing protein [Myxococcota bacterium]